MSDDSLRYFIEIDAQTFEIRALRGREAASAWSRFELSFTVGGANPLEPDELVGGEATLVIQRSGVTRRVTLVIAEIDRACVPRADDAYGADVHVVLESRLGRLRHRADLRVFRDMNYPAIAAAVIGAHGIAVSRRLASSYPARPYTVQYRETDLAFAARLLEDEGIGYAVEDDGSVTFFDSPAAYAPLGPIPFQPAGGLVPGEDAVTNLGFRGRLAPSRVALADFDFEHPSRPVTSTSAVSGAGGSEWYDFPARRTVDGEVSTKSGRQAEAFTANRRQLAGSTTRVHVRPTTTWELFGAPTGVPDGQYAIASVQHDFRHHEGHSLFGFTAVEARETLRPEPTTPWPRIAGPLPGFVTGHAGEDIHTDQWGRAKIHFPWDRLQPADETCSHWIPTLQDNTGHSIGIPRIGWEMLVHFVEGNPDEPVILGRVFNPLDPLHVTLPGDKTRSALRSLTSPRDPKVVRENLIEFEDTKGSEELHMRAERDRTVVVEHDKTEHTAREDQRDIRRNEEIKVGIDRSVHIGGAAAFKAAGNQTTTIGANHERTVDEAESQSITGRHSLTIGSMHQRRIETTDSVNTKGVLTEKVGAVLLEASVRENLRHASMASLTLVGGAVLDVAGRTVSRTIGKDRIEVTGIMRMTQAGERIATACEAERKTSVGGNMTAKAGTFSAISGQDELEMNLGAGEFLGSDKVTLKVGETKIVLEKGEIAFDAKTTISISAKNRGHIKTGRSKQNP